MTISNRSSLQENNNVQLVRSADSLDSALAQFSKLAASIEHSTPIPAQLNSGKGFDEWIANDLQYGVLLGGDETPLATSPQSTDVESPLLEQEQLATNVMTSMFEPSNSSQAFSYQAQVSVDTSLGLSTATLQRAAAALNIPWTYELERTVLTQSQELSNLITGSQTLNLLQNSTSNTTQARNNRRPRSTEEEEESEETLAKRAKNTDAARRSRLKKMVKLDTLEVKVKDLETTNSRLNTRVAVLETEKNGFLIKEAEQNARIAQLEAKIMEAHLTLKTRHP
ncbi:hypothetical protein BGZ76_000760 [Entomortierella beljakovae]|nr:hypothetical protein BGZ76_000760 [Entomortierella beljakovae]